MFMIGIGKIVKMINCGMCMCRNRDGMGVSADFNVMCMLWNSNAVTVIANTAQLNTMIMVQIMGVIILT